MGVPAGYLIDVTDERFIIEEWGYHAEIVPPGGAPSFTCCDIWYHRHYRADTARRHGEQQARAHARNVARAHGRHCACTPCRNTDWSDPSIAPCDWHPRGCPA